MSASEDNPLFQFIWEQQTEATDSLIAGYAKRDPRAVLADCDRMLQCIAGFDTVFMLSPAQAARLSRGLDADWLAGFNHTFEMLCLAGTERGIALEPFKELATSAYSFWTGSLPVREMADALTRLFRPCISALYNLKRALIVECGKAGTDDAVERAQRLAGLRERFEALATLKDRQKAGRDLEGVLKEVFALSGLHSREPFRVAGEQIDGSFELDHETYLLEAKWEASRLSQQPLLVFREKIAAKSHFTRGVLLAMNGITDEARDAIVRGKAPNFFLMDGDDLREVLAGRVPLGGLLRAKARHLAETGDIFYPVRSLPEGESGDSP